MFFILHNEHFKNAYRVIQEKCKLLFDFAFNADFFDQIQMINNDSN